MEDKNSRVYALLKRLDENRKEIESWSDREIYFISRTPDGKYLPKDVVKRARENLFKENNSNTNSK